MGITVHQLEAMVLCLLTWSYQANEASNDSAPRLIKPLAPACSAPPPGPIASLLCSCTLYLYIRGREEQFEKLVEVEHGVSRHRLQEGLKHELLLGDPVNIGLAF